MSKYICKKFFFVFLIFPLVSFGQINFRNEISLQSNTSSHIPVEVTAWSAASSSGNSQMDKLSSRIAAGFESFNRNTESLKNNEKTFPKNFVSLKLGADDPWFGIAYERLLSPYIGTEFQIGLIGASLGAKFYFPAIRSGRLNFHVGVLPGWGFMGGLKTYFPIGINVLTKNNFRFSLDAGPRIWHDDGEENFLGFSLKIGKAF
ncbi:MAG: hypothetical protein V2I46_14880 [Bacteroides sp.]|jgi:hypothetical protein|nr:hypothetical protein [Bacteroides sp.]